MTLEEKLIWLLKGTDYIKLIAISYLKKERKKPLAAQDYGKI